MAAVPIAKFFIAIENLVIVKCMATVQVFVIVLYESFFLYDCLMIDGLNGIN